MMGVSRLLTRDNNLTIKSNDEEARAIFNLLRMIKMYAKMLEWNFKCMLSCAHLHLKVISQIRFKLQGSTRVINV